MSRAPQPAAPPGRPPRHLRLRLLPVALLVLVVSAAPLLVDKHESCQSWAESGECSNNPTYMSDNCAASCKNANKYKSQMKRECEGYAQQGECSRNPAFMLSSCRAECDAWEKQHGLKIDRDAMCVQWSLLGECSKDPKGMAKKCNTSCTVQQRCARSTYTGWSVGICDKALRCEPKDQRGDCEQRAKAGACARDPTRMAIECLHSCAEHDVDSVLKAQKPEMVRRSPFLPPTTLPDI